MKTINVYDADEERTPIPLYLDFDTIMQQLDVTELSNELVTAIRPFGADDLDIRSVNPIGTNWIYDISYFISNGDVPKSLANKWTAWQNEVLVNREYYRGLTSMRAAATARLLSENAALVDLQGELESVNIQQNTITQQYAEEITEEGKQYMEEVLRDLKAQETSKKAEIDAKKTDIAKIESDRDGYDADISAVVERLALVHYFTADEVSTLKKFFIEQTLEEETFVATDVDTTVTGSTYDMAACSATITGSKISMVDFGEEYARDIYVINGGKYSVAGENTFSGDVIRGTLELYQAGNFMLSLYIGESTIIDQTAPSGLITLMGTVGSHSDDVAPTYEGDVVTQEGTRISIDGTDCTIYMTANVSDYQKYAVQSELYDYAVNVLSDKATPTYEFDVDSANFIFTQELAQFRNELELGKPIYLRLHDGTVIKPILIEFEVDFEDRSVIDLVFSNRFKRPDNVNTLKDMIESSYSSSHSFDLNKYIYGRSADQASKVSQFMSGSLDAAVNEILGARNQTVLINGAGIQVGGDSNYQLRIVDRMIAISDDGWETAKLAIGHFYSDEIGEYFGVNADVIGGKLIVGNNLIIESVADGGVVKQFRFDSTGAWINNGTFTIQQDDGGKIIIDPRYGILAGTEDLYDTSGTTVTPNFIDENGDIILDKDGFPEHANFYLDLRDGSAYFRGTIHADEGEVGGWTIADDSLSSGTGTRHVELNSSGDTNSLYAIWAGADDPANAPFWVKRDGSIRAQNGTFGGTLNAAKLSGALTVDEESENGGWLEGCGIRVGVNPQSSVGYNFYVDDQGNVTITNGQISWGTIIESDEIEDAIEQAQSDADDAASAASSAANLARRIANGTFSGGTFINNKEIYAPTIYANEFDILPNDKSSTTGGLNLYGRWGNSDYLMLGISYVDGGGSPNLSFSCSSNGVVTYWQLPETYWSGYHDFSGATVTGLVAKFG